MQRVASIFHEANGPSIKRIDALWYIPSGIRFFSVSVSFDGNAISGQIENEEL